MIVNTQNTLVIGFPEYREQAEAFARAAGLTFASLEIHRFPDAESKLTLPAELPAHVILCRSLDRPNDKLVELILAAEGARELGARTLSLVAPYLCYMRQDKAFHPGEVVSQRVLGRCLADYFDNLLTVDSHLHRVHDLGDAVPLGHAIDVHATAPMAHFIEAHVEHAFLIGPDGESGQWVADIADHYRMDHAVATKERLGDNAVRVTLPDGDYQGRHIVLVDDVASTGHTLLEAARALASYRPASMSVLVTHALFVGDAIEQLHRAGIDNIWSCDSIPHPTNAVPLAGLLAARVTAFSETPPRPNPVARLDILAQSPWLDYIQRDLLTNGGLRRMIARDGIRGVTSNPAIFAKAVTQHDDYAEAIRALRPTHANVTELYEALALRDIRLAADQLLPVYYVSDRLDGYVSLEVSPDLAYDSDATIAEAQRLWAAIDRPNAMIKVPATEAGLTAIRELTAAGLNINATLIFSPTRYLAVAEAWQAGIARREAAGQSIIGVTSVASFFISRIESLADKRVRDKAPRLQGRVAVAAARIAYQSFRRLLLSADWQRLVDAGVRPQRLLWASTSTKNPDYADIKYVEELIGPYTVNTLPPKTLDAYRDHGRPAPRLETGVDEARRVMAELEENGIDFEAIAAQLEKEGVEKFQAAFRQLLEALEQA